jgi:Ni,Fe-hydrogenase I cytochrome b subunit
MKEKQGPRRRGQQIQIPSVYRYLALGLLLPILVVTGMIIGYNYGTPSGDFSAFTFAGIGSIVGLIIASAIIIKIALRWDENIQRYTRRSKTKPSRRTGRNSSKG